MREEPPLATLALGAIDVARARDGVESLADPERAVFLAFETSGLVDSGGFRYFYELRASAEPAARAFADLGLPEAARACLESAKGLPRGRPPRDRRSRIEFLDRHRERIEAAWAPLDTAIHAIHDELAIRVAEFLREHEGRLPNADGLVLIDRLRPGWSSLEAWTTEQAWADRVWQYLAVSPAWLLYPPPEVDPRAVAIALAGIGATEAARVIGDAIAKGGRMAGTEMGAAFVAAAALNRYALGHRDRLETLPGGTG